MFGVCLRYSQDHMEAEDTLLEGFMKVFQNIHQFKGNGSFEGWIRRIMVNTALKKFRSRRQNLFTDTPVEELIDVSEHYTISGYEKLKVNDLMRFVEALAPGYKIVFSLYAIEGYSHKEISEQLQISENTSKSQLSRARVVLQKMLAQHFESLPVRKSVG